MTRRRYDVKVGTYSNPLSPAHSEDRTMLEGGDDDRIRWLKQNIKDLYVAEIHQPLRVICCVCHDVPRSRGSAAKYLKVDDRRYVCTKVACLDKVTAPG